MENIPLFIEKKIVKIFCDGGVVGPNPSDFGGTYGFVAVDENDEFVFSGSGFVQSPDGKTTNNHTEYYAAIMALESMHQGWSGFLVSDSKITLGRLFEGWKCKNLPEEYIIRAKKALARLGAVKGLHVNGHATKKELEEGIGKKGNAVSKWNNFVDELCTNEVNKVKGRA